MTSKDKAKELVEKFNIDNWDDAKSCALICVYEIDKELGFIFLYGDKRRVYYREVKQEISKL